MGQKNILVIYTGWLEGVISTASKVAEKDVELTLLIHSKSKHLFEGQSLFNKTITYGKKNFIGDIHNLKQELQEDNYDSAIIPIKEKEIDGIRYIGLKNLLKISGIKKIKTFSENSDDLQVNSRSMLIKSLLDMLLLFTAPIVIFFRTPIYIWNELIKNFIFFKKKKEEDEILGFGAFGLLYFITRSKMAKKFGIAGIAHDDYMGTPVMLHRGPIEMLLQNKIGYPKLIVLSMFLMAFAFTGFAVHTNNYYCLILLPFIFSSTYFVDHIFGGVPEPLSWAFFSLVLLFYIKGNILIAAIFFTLLVITHVLIGALLGSIIIMDILLDLIENGLSVGTIYWAVLLFSLTFLLSSWFIIPFVKNKGKLARNKLIDKHYGMSYKWTRQSLTQVVLYSAFIASNFIVFPENLGNYLLIIPLIALYVNVKLKWIFSEQTVCMFMLVMGFIAITSNPSIIPAILYLFLINTSPELHVPFLERAKRYGFSLEPLIFESKKKYEILKLFSTLPESSRVVLEGGKIKETTAYLNNLLLSCVMIDSDIELLNGYSPDFVEASIYLDMVQFLNRNISYEKLKTILIKSGSGFIAVYDDRFKEKLDEFNFKFLGSVDCRDIRWVKNREGFTISLFEAPFEVKRIEPETQLMLDSNKIVFNAKKGVQYFIKYSFYTGWRATQNGKVIDVIDGNPGMIINAKEDGAVILKYNYIYYLT